MNADYQQLQQQLNHLKERLPGLSSRLSQAAVELKEAGVPVDERLSEQLIAYRQEFAGLKSRAIELAKTYSVPGVVAPTQISSLHDIQGVLHAIARSGGEVNESQKALYYIDRFLSLTHRDQPHFAPLEEAKGKARELRHIILNSSPTNFPPDVPALLSGQHPCCTFLSLIEPDANIADEEWERMQEVCGRAFGKPLTLAASRGKLQFSGTVTAPAPTVTAPAPKVTAPAASPPRRSPEMVVIAGSTEAVEPTDTEAEVERLLSQQPVSPPSNLPDVIILPSSDDSPSRSQVAPPNPNFAPTPPKMSGLSGVGIEVGLNVLVHIERIGDHQFHEHEFAGTRGKALRLEAFALEIKPPIPGLGIRYMAHIQGSGDTPWVTEGEWVGARGSGLRIEGLAIELTGPEAPNYAVYYKAHIERVGDTQEFSNGEFCGRRGMGLRVEGIEIHIDRK
ncbi:hypothetical protein NG796_12730 [Laspinema sp. A4]|uniref:hypothetical protein n=1 Tax=Laspinema sp. D2d TaxID=2953686 RepID=UPI0021BB7A38|nr:hypothetical protein [Laspinema sp. D2d]MCT7984161.1 hypothetical protein [Laspinema sp. D2d]